MREDYKKEYIKKIKTFFEKIPKDHLEGIPSFHIPTVDKLYGTTSPKLAIFGMEARGQGCLQGTKNIFKDKDNEDAGIEHFMKKFSESGFTDWRMGYFKDFTLQLLAKLYDINDYKNLMHYQRYSFVLDSFIWGNINSLERFETNKANSSIANKVRKESEDIFDSAEIILKTCAPDVIIILHWVEDTSWFGGGYTLNEEKMDVITDRFWYGRVEKIDTHPRTRIRTYTYTHTHVLWLDHPRLIAVHPGFKKTINLIHECLKEHNIRFELKNLYSAN